jgi:hypothetical protein
MIAEYSVALPATLHRELCRHLWRADGQEDLCFAIWYPSRGRIRLTALLHTVILPKDGERTVHGNASFQPRYFERAVGEAAAAGGGLAFLHSHLGPGWQGMSSDDVKAEIGHAAAAQGATGLPLLGLTLGTDGAWSARFWTKTAPRKYERRWCETVRVVGEPFSITYADALRSRPQLKEELRRTVSAWGTEAQATLARLRVGIVGAGSVGTIIAEALARTGISRIVLIDFDTVKTVNVDRMLHATSGTAGRGEPKVRSLARGIRQGATADGFTVEEVNRSVVEEEGFRAALDCDVLFSCVDRPWPRAALNFVAYAHLIPVIDGGIQVEVTSRKTLRRADWKAHVAMPDRRCLECLGQYDPGLVSAEREGLLDDPEYIRGLPESHPIRRNENVIAFSFNVAGLEMLQFLMMVVAPLGVSNAGQQSYHFVPGIFDEPKFETCKENCLYPALIGRGDQANLAVTGQHKAAEANRIRKSARPPSAEAIGYRVGRWWARVEKRWRLQ